MATINWTAGVSGDWNTGTLWTPGTVPLAADDVVIDATPPVGGSYTVTIAAGASETVRSLTMNNTDANKVLANSDPYRAGELELDGTLTFAAGSAGLLDGSLQTFIHTQGGVNAAIINGGTINGFVQVEGNLLMTGTNGVYITNYLQALAGSVTIDTSSIAEFDAVNKTLFDGIFEAKGGGSVVNLGGSRGGLIVNMATIEGPPLVSGGWTELVFNDPAAAINEWNGTAYVSVETTLVDIKSAGTVDVLAGRNYSTGTNTLTVEGGTGTNAPGMLNLQAGTVTTGGIIIAAGGIVQGAATVVGGVTNNGTLIAEGGTLNLTGGLTGTGRVEFDFDRQQGTVSAIGGTLIVGSVSAGQTIVMNGKDTLNLTAPLSFAGTIQAKVGDKIVLGGSTATSATYNASNGTLTVLNGTQTVASLLLGGSYVGDQFTTAGSVVTISTGAAKTTVAANDFNGDGTSDILFQHSSGTILNWQMSNGAIAASQPIAGATPDWVEVGTGHFHGTATSDILFQNTTSGTVLDWQMSGGKLGASQAIAGASADWKLIGTGDFNGDGTSDILFQNNNSGTVLDWQMSNGQLAASQAIAGASFDWKFIGTGDFNGDGTSDILFQNSNSGTVLDWQMSNGAFGQSVAIAGASADWKFVGVGDFTGSGTSDILFQNSNSNELLYWEMSKGALVKGVSIGALAAGQSVVGIGDYNGDGTSDILVGNGSGSVSDWQMSNGALSKVTAVGGATSDWKLLG